MDKKVNVKYKDIILDKTGQFSGVTAVDLNGCNLLSDGTTTPVGDYQITGVTNGNISDGRYLFYRCNNLKTLNNITFNGLTDALFMFRGTAIDSIPEGIDWSKITYCNGMFMDAPITGDIALNLPAVTACVQMLSNTNINSLSFTADTVNNTNTKPVVSGNIIQHLSLTYPNATAVDNALTLPALEDYTVNAPVASAITGSIANINVDATITFNAPQVVNIGYLFSGCKRANLDEVNIPFEQIMSAQSTFQNYSALTGFSKEMPNLVNANSMFSGCSSLTGLTMNLPSVSSASYILYGCSSLTNVSISAESLKIASNMLDGKNYPHLSSVTLNLPSSNTLPSFTTFSAYPSLKRVEIVSNIPSPPRMIHSAVTDVKFVLPNATGLNNLCSSASTLTGITIVADKALSANNTFSFCKAITNIDDIHFDFSKLKSAQNTFQGCSGLTQVALDLPEVTACSNIFSGCSSLENINFSASKLSGGTAPIAGTYPALTSITLDFPAWTGYTSFSSATNYPAMKIVDETTDWSGNTSSIITRLISSGVTDATFTFPHALGVNNICRDAKALTSVTINAPLATSCTGTFYGCSSLTEANMLHTENIVSAKSMFHNCSSLTSFEGDMRNVISIAYMFTNCTKLSHVSMIINALDSAWTQSSFGVHSSAPCQAHRYCFSRNDDNVRLIFTSDDYGSSDYQQIDCTDDNRTETLTADTIIVLNDNGSYIADPPAGPASNPNAPIHINILLDGVLVTTTPSQLSRGKFTWSKEEHDGWTQWQDKLWYQHEPIN